MKSEIQGPMEKIVTPMVEKIRAPALSGVDVRFNPDAAKAVADLLEMLAQHADNESAERLWNTKINLTLYGAIFFCSGLAFLAKFF